MCKNSLFSRTSPILLKLQNLLKDPQTAINEQGINLYEDFERCRKEARKMSIPSDVHERLKVILLIPQVGSILELAQRTQKSRAFVKRCLQRFYQEGFAGTQTRPRSGRPQVIKPEHHQLLFTLLDFYPSFLIKQGLFPELSAQLANSDRWTATALSSILHVQAANIRNYLKRINVSLQQKGSHRIEHDPDCPQRLHDIELLTKQLNDDYVVLCCGTLPNISLQETANEQEPSAVQSARDLENQPHSLTKVAASSTLQATEQAVDSSSYEQSASIFNQVHKPSSQAYSTNKLSGDLGVFHQDLGTNLKASGDFSTSFEVSQPQESTVFSQSPELAARWYAAMNKHVPKQAADQSGQSLAPSGHLAQSNQPLSQDNFSSQEALETEDSYLEAEPYFVRDSDLDNAQNIEVMVACNPSTHEVYSCFTKKIDYDAWQDFVGRLEKMPKLKNKHLCLIFNRERSTQEKQVELAHKWEQQHPNSELHFVPPSSSWVDHVTDVLYSYQSMVLSEPEWHDFASFRELSVDFFRSYPQDELEE